MQSHKRADCGITSKNKLMKYLKFAFIFSLISIFLLSCQKEKLEEDISINAQMHENIRTANRTQQTAAFTTVGIRNPDLVSNFYNDMIGLQESTRFYDDLYETHGYMDWFRAVEYQVEEGGHILVVPVHQEENGFTNGIFLYFDSGDEQKVTFYTRTELDQKVALSESSRLNNDEIFAYRNLALHELRKKGWSEDFTYDLRTVLGGDEEEGGGGPTEGGPTEGGTTEGPECEGGSFQWVCAFIPADSGADGIDASVINTYIDNNYGHGAAIRDQFDGYSFFELRDNFDQILGNIWAGHRESFLEYFNDRESLYNNTGLGNGSDGILIGTIETLIRECAWIWVWCWQDPFDLELNLGGGGGGSTGPYVEPWEDDYNRLRFCEGVYDLHDTGPDNPDMIHPDYDYCIIWMEYLNDCIIPNLPSTYNQPGYPTYADYIEQWAQIQEFEPELFARVISGAEGCISTDEIDDYVTEYYEDIECNNALRTFEDAYGLELSKTERRAIWGAFEEDEESPACGDQEAFDRWVIEHLVDQDLNDGSTIVETDGDEPTNITNSILPYSCESFIIESTSVPGRYRTQITWWEPSITTFSLIPFGYRHYDYMITVEIFFDPLPGEPECEIKNILADAFNTASQAAVRTFAQARQYLLPEDAAEIELEELMEAYLAINLAPHFPLSLPLINVPATVELDGYPLIPKFPGEDEDCCE